MAATNDLPVRELEQPLAEALRGGTRVIVEAPAGSGKSTLIPQMLLDRGLAGNGRIVVLQPRRLAARMLARWVARQRGCPLGGEVGYQVRFDNRSGDATRIKYETDGILLRQAAAAPDLPGVGTIVFDEFHERHVFGDVMLALALRLQEAARPDLKLVVMSATLDTRALEQYLAPCAVLRSAGRVHPVSLEYLDRPPRADRDAPWDLAAAHFDRLVRAQPEGDVLVFMPGAYEIRRTLEAIGRCPAAKPFRLLPLHGELPAAAQDEAVAPGAGRKVVVATNVAETSITIDGVSLVIDSGLARKARFDPYRGINTLLIEKISRASAEQRAGRAGRTRPGHCLRLWTEPDQAARPAHDPPEIQRIDLAEVILDLKLAGIDDIAAYRWLDPPGARELERALALLTDLGALAPGTGALTDLGRRLQPFPLHPRQARLLVEAERHGCVRAAALLAALGQERSILLAAPGRDALEKRERALGEETESDLLLMLRAWDYARQADFSLEACAAIGVHAQAARGVQAAFRQILGVADGLGLDTRDAGASPEALRRCILAGFSDQVGRRAVPGSPRYDLVHRRRGTLDKGVAVRSSELIVASEIQEIGRSQGEVEVRLSQVTAIEADWLRELFPADLHTERAVDYDAASKHVEARERLLFRDLVIRDQRGQAPTADEAAAVLAGLVLKGTLTLKQWDHHVEQWIRRVNVLAEAWPDLGLPRIGDEDRRAMIEHACHGATGYKDIKEKPVWPVVKGWLSAAQRALVDQYAPERVKLPNGRTPKVAYDAGQPPSIALRIQELYGVEKPVTLAGGRIRLLIRAQAPNYRTVQITDDLKSFWTTIYPQAKKELQRKYPKHEWR